jgi:hypothetical protein
MIRDHDRQAADIRCRPANRAQIRIGVDLRIAELTRVKRDSPMFTA